jgi:cytochrome o ubiquinol oxidase subunit 2
MVSSCAGVLDVKGPVGDAERTILFDATAIMSAVIAPVIVLTLAFAWRYRAGAAGAVRWPEWSYSGPLEFVVWSIPTLVVLFLGGIAWIGSHELDPRRPIASTDQKPIDVEVVSLDWKWLFIYPAEGIASVNQLTAPAGTPIRLRLTSASVMNSFFIPGLGSQIYTMAGMTTQLNLLADRPGDYPGLSAQFSGDGFSNMRFDLKVATRDGFEDWIATARKGGGALDAARYAELAKPSLADGRSTFGAVAPDLFETILADSAPGGGGMSSNVPPSR